MHTLNDLQSPSLAREFNASKKIYQIIYVFPKSKFWVFKCSTHEIIINLLYLQMPAVSLA